MRLKVKVAIELSAEETERTVRILRLAREASSAMDLTDEDHQFIADMQEITQRARNTCKA